MGGPIPWTGTPGWFKSGEKDLSTHSLLSAVGCGCDEELQVLSAVASPQGWTASWNCEPNNSLSPKLLLSRYFIMTIGTKIMACIEPSPQLQTPLLACMP